MKIRDMPKLDSPFLRVYDKDNNFLVISQINPGYEWVFEDPDVICTEKLDGTNVSVVIQNGHIESIWNRTERLPFFNKGKSHIIKGILESFERGYLELPDGQYFGELIGKKLQGNPYKIDGHLWLPFATYAQDHLKYKSWGKYPKDYETISRWFKDDIFSLYMARTQSKHGKMYKTFPEGVVFVQPSTGKMAKLRRDMFDWFAGPRHKEVPEEEKVSTDGIA